MLENITKREQEVLNIMLEGVPLKDIAERLNLSYHTVDTHRTRIYRKLGVKNIQELLVEYNSSRQYQNISSNDIFSIASVKKPLKIMLADNAPINYYLELYPFKNKNYKISAGDTFIFSYSFISNIDLGVLFIAFQDMTKGWVPLSPNVHLKGDIKKNIKYKGNVTIIATNTASSTDPNANLVSIGTHPYTVEQPTITFTKFELLKINKNQV